MKITEILEKLKEYAKGDFDEIITIVDRINLEDIELGGRLAHIVEQEIENLDKEVDSGYVIKTDYIDIWIYVYDEGKIFIVYKKEKRERLYIMKFHCHHNIRDCCHEKRWEMIEKAKIDEQWITVYENIWENE